MYKGEHLKRTTQPKVRFREHNLVDFEPEDDEDDGTAVVMMERRRSNASNNNISNTLTNSHFATKKDNNNKEQDESSDDGYIDDEALEAPTDELVVFESIEIEEVCEQIEILDVSAIDNMTENEASSPAMMTTTTTTTMTTTMVVADEANYDDDEFHKDEEPNATVSAEKMRNAEQRKLSLDRASTATKKIFRTKINPVDDDTVAVRAALRRAKKECCHYKETDEYKQKLPKYNGFHSQYGFSKEELEKRDTQQLEHARTQYRRKSQHFEQKEFLAQTNEEAFRKW